MVVTNKHVCVRKLQQLPMLGFFTGGQPIPHRSTLPCFPVLLARTQRGKRRCWPPTYHS